jgi:hypothetical protein
MILAQGVPMLVEFNEQEGPDLERLCQGMSANDEPCGYPATVHCPTCTRWFCDAHAEDEDWHSCVNRKTKAARLSSRQKRNSVYFFSHMSQNSLTVPGPCPA